ncbi:hypothetical protein FRB94_012744 [Tulasnella sp. JGI-2019a]|nr:hypothetical protein FRB94_012744 [Tulasnella sp. JGI-2019a]KAG9018456.1 hypothetical protein FRB93_000159 [Tulasnella sp. JGI-2019a]
MTLGIVHHHAFDDLRLWFEAVEEVSNQYNVCVVPDLDIYIPRPVVTFTTPNETLLPVPNTRLLKLHATCAKVANLSGASEYVDTINCEMEELEELASDGTSADVLDFAIARILMR